ncbi:hypothetical protein GFL93_12620 [Rhizobium leguminosarum bv. viciae]|uniref:hypothetical protein n=1 Tax=Rhizobium TaxID=379 RepID=UPI001441A679|nr:hypothetical protein [Rhizobium leguminosarum]NKK06704.1 hypothetical protein [Rhizobium leguminosarum bv. viciae]
MSPFETIIIAAQKAQEQFSVIHGTQEDNAEIIKELSKAFIGSISELVHAAGGDNGYIEPWSDGVEDDIDRCFFSANNPIPADVFKPRAGLLKLIVKGASMR